MSLICSIQQDVLDKCITESGEKRIFNFSLINGIETIDNDAFSEGKMNEVHMLYLSFHKSN